jgi:inner membrane protein
MEPVTHFLTGACIGRAGFNRRTAYGTLAATLAAEAPDMDEFWSFAGPVTGLAHHRGITHTLIAGPFMALAITGLVWSLDRLIFSRRKSIRASQPVHWGWVWFTAFVAHLSHLVLDWTNNYGVRPFFPFNRHWYSGDLVFIAEPVLWGILLAALVMPALLGLADREVGARRIPFRGRGWAVAALCSMVILWCWRWAEQAQARNMVEAAQVTNSPIRRIALEPYPVNPFRWHALLETETAWQTAEVDTHRGIVDSDPKTNSLFKPSPSAAVNVARRSYLGKVYLDWSQWPVVRDVGAEAVPGNPAPGFPPSREWTTVQFSDLRFAYPYLDMIRIGSTNQSLSHMLSNTGLTGWVYVIDGKEEAGEYLNARGQK